MADEKTEEPTSRKLEKAHDDGSFPKSQEVTSAVVFAMVLVMLIAGGRVMFEQFRTLINVAVEISSNNISLEVLWDKLGSVYKIALWLIIPVACVSALAGVIGSVIQIGFRVSFKPVSPNVENISPVKGIKKIFSIKAVFELLQMIVRAFVVGAIAWWLIRGAITLFSGAAYQTLPIIGQTAWYLVTRLLKFALLAFLIMSVIDYALQRWQFMKGQRMSKDEVKREYKESEGDPLIKSKRIQMSRENAENAGNNRAGVQHANVILTNPTHYAVAVAYEPGRYDVPTIVARGADEDAKKIREEAALLGIPIFSNPPLARALYKTGINRQVPREFFGVIAALLIWLRQMNKINESYAGISTTLSEKP
jgi:type III secretion protein U